MSKEHEQPKIRPLEADLVEHDGQQLVRLRDPEGFSEATLAVPPHVFFIINHFNGENSMSDIQAAFVSQFGEVLFHDTVKDIIEKLDEHFFLDSERFRTFRKEIEDEFRSLPVRKAAHKGGAYPAEAKDIQELLKGFWEIENGPGEAPGEPKNGLIKGVISPHIDIWRGGWCYAHAYKQVAEAEQAETYVILGTAHSGGAFLFALTDKPYETPLGQMKVDTELIEAFKGEVPDPDHYYRGELAHKDEHSIEFQVLYLQHILGEKAADVQVVTVLCGSFFKMVQDGHSPAANEEFDTFSKGMRSAIEKTGRKVTFIAGVDLSHVGPKFGDPEPLRPTALLALEVADRRTLSHAVDLDAEKFYRGIEAEKDRRKICGLSSIYSLLYLMGADEGELLRYGQSYEEDTGSVVTYASAVFR